MMNFSDETVEKCANAYKYSSGVHHSEMMRSAISSLTLADLMQVEEVRALVEAGRLAFDNAPILSPQFNALGKALTPFTEPKQ